MTPLLRVVVFEGLPGTWVAQALEYDIVAEGPSTEGAVEAVLRILEAHIDFARRHNREPLSGFYAAPRHYWNAFAQATPLESQWLHRDPQPAIPGRVIAAIAHERPLARCLRSHSDAIRRFARDPPCHRFPS